MHCWDSRGGTGLVGDISFSLKNRSSYYFIYSVCNSCTTVCLPVWKIIHSLKLALAMDYLPYMPINYIHVTVIPHFVLPYEETIHEL